MSEAALRLGPPPWQRVETPVGPTDAVAIADDILKRCRGEGPANCVNRCPLHVDARGYVQLAREGRYREALQLVREQLPFPGVLGYVCAHPCEQHCKRIDEDSAIRIRDIKRFLAEWESGEPQHIVDCEPARDGSVAVVGGGPAGLLAAHDLRRRGWSVVVLERGERIGGCLIDKIPPYRLPRHIVERDLSVIGALGIEVRTGVEVGRDVSLGELRERFSAVLLLVGFEGALRLVGTQPELAGGRPGTLAVDAETCATALPGVFAGGNAISGPSTVIEALALGRRVAESVHRFLTGAELRADREPLRPAALLWGLDTDDVERSRRVRVPMMMEPFNEALDEHAARAEAERCLDCTCGLCVKDCEFLATYCDSPKRLARAVKTDIGAVRDMVYSCNICSLCAQVCPEGLDTGAMLLAARREAVQAGIGPLPQHKPIISYFKAGVSGTFSLFMPEPGRSKSKRLFFAGCGLPAISPRSTIVIYDALRRAYPGTGVMMYCCGAPVELLGMEEPFEHAIDEIGRQAERLGAEELIAACPDCTHVLKGAALSGVKVRTVWEALAGNWQPPRSRDGVRVSVHDSCKAHHEPATHAGVRRLIEESGAIVEDIEYRGEKARCCGNGGMIYPVDPKLFARIAKRRGDESPHPMVSYCAGCRMAIASQGKQSVHLMDFLLDADWAKVARGGPTGSIARYTNRLRTKWAFKRLRPLKGE